MRQSTSLEAAAQGLVQTICTDFVESVVLARVFCTVPFDVLPAQNRHFVERLVAAKEDGRHIGAATPVLSLVGTHGSEPDWQDRRMSRGHLGIPLISASFVNGIPMIARVLAELGIPVAATPNHSAMVQKTIGRSAGLFFVDNAEEAIDDRNRKIIVDTDFVHDHHVRAVFGVGATYVGGQVVVLIVFCRDSLPRESAECFMALTALFKGKTAELVGAGKIFAPSTT